MKKLLTLFAISLAVVLSSCSTFDDEAIWNKLDDHESRISRLEEMCREMNSNIDALQTIVTALQTNDYVTSVTPVTKDGETVGYTITFTKSDPITIYHGTDGKDGANGKDGKDGGYTPIIGVKQDADGIYYWTLDGEWLLDENGNKIKAQGTDGKDGIDGTDGKDGVDGADGKDGVDGADGKDGADGITPLLKIENDYWYISYDNGVSWTQLGKATGEDGKDGADGKDGIDGADGKDGIDGANGADGMDGKDGDSFFQSVTQDEQFVYFTLADGTVITLPKGAALDITFAESDLVVMSPNSTREIGYTVTSATETVKVEVTSSADIKAKAVTDNASGLTGKIHIITGDAIDEYSKVIVFVSNGDKVIMRSITFEEAGLQVEENATKFATAEGGEMTLEFLSNVECEVVIPEDAQSWISVVPATRALEKQTITLKLEPNEGAARSAEVVVKSTDGNLSLTYTITQEPNLDYQLALEREALIAIYNALDGDNWTNNENWCSDKPVREWWGVETDYIGRVNSLNLHYNGLVGDMPSTLYDLTGLTQLYLDNNDINSFPNGISSLSKLTRLTLPAASKMPIDEIFGLRDLYDISLDLHNINNANFEIALNNWKNAKYISISVNDADCIELPNDFSDLNQLTILNLSGFCGTISPTIEECTQLLSLNIQDGKVTGEIPSTIGNLQHLSTLNLSNNLLSGSIPKEIFNCPLAIINLHNNRLSGELPKEFGDWLSSVQDLVIAGGSFECTLYDNDLSSIPKTVQKHTIWNVVWPEVLLGNRINYDDVELPALHLEGCDIDGVAINSDTDYAKYDYTIIWSHALLWLEAPITTVFDLEYMNSLYEKYKSLNIQFLYVSCETDHEDELHQFRLNNYMPWRILCTAYSSTNRAYISYGQTTSYLPLYFYDALEGEYVTRVNQVSIVDKNGNLIHNTFMANGESDELLTYFLEKTLDGAGSDLYQSSDYSSDGNVTTLQTATKGDGIDIVLMGDAYSDRQIADGTYKTDMENLYNNLFTEEPYKSFKDHFNVHYVNVVSKNEGYGVYNETALAGYFGGGSLVGGNDNAAFNYALKAISEEEMDEALLIVAMNSDNYAGTCYMYYPTYTTGTYGSGPSVAYFPRGGDAETFAQLLHHEACGHGFAKLADEYAYEDMGAVSSDYVSQITSQQNDWGWWKNVDFTSDTSAIRWSNFINDARYANEGLGAFEGGLTYWSGVWRPTENSIMRYNTGGFNAPSREAIYYRIHKLAYGDSWEYDYEEFVEWDAINRTAAAAAKRKSTKPATYKPTHAPIIVNKSWRDAK